MQTIVGRDDNLLTIEDANVLLVCTEVDIDDVTFSKSIIKAAVEPPSGRPAETSPTTRGPSPPGSAERKAATTFVDDVVNTSMEDRIVELTGSSEGAFTSDEKGRLLFFDRWLVFITRCIRLQLMQDTLVQRKGISNIGGRGISRAGGSVSDKSLIRQSSRADTMKRSLSNGSVLDGDGEGSIPSYMNSQFTGYSRTLGDLNSSMVANPSTSALRTKSQPDLSQSRAGAEERLAPLKLKKQKKEISALELRNTAGYDRCFGRETPRCLRPGERDMTMTKAQAIEDLRRELHMAREGLAHIDTVLADNITWVRANCDMKGTDGQSRTLSDRAVKQCQRMAAERFFEVLDSYRQVSLKNSFMRMKVAVKVAIIADTSKDYAQAKGIEIMSNVILDAMARQYRKMFGPWLLRTKWEQRWEQEAAAVEMQRVALGFMGRRRVLRIVRHRNSIIIQCAIRVFLSKCRAQHRRLQRKLQIAAYIMTRWAHGHLAVRRAKATVQHRREMRAATKIQKVQRGIMGRARFRQIKEWQRRLYFAARTIQKIYRSKIQAYNRVAAKKRRIEAERVEQRRIADLRKKAAVKIQTLARIVQAKARVNAKREEKLRVEKARMLQRMARRQSETKADRELLGKRKIIKNGITKMQAHIRGMLGRKRVRRIREEQNRPITPKSPKKSPKVDAKGDEHTAAVKLQSMFRGVRDREKADEKRQEKQKNSKRLFKSKSSATDEPKVEKTSSRLMNFMRPSSREISDGESGSMERPKSSSRDKSTHSSDHDHEAEKLPARVEKEKSSSRILNFMRLPSRESKDGSDVDNTGDAQKSSSRQQLSGRSDKDADSAGASSARSADRSRPSSSKSDRHSTPRDEIGDKSSARSDDDGETTSQPQLRLIPHALSAVFEPEQGEVSSPQTPDHTRPSSPRDPVQETCTAQPPDEDNEVASILIGEGAKVADDVSGAGDTTADDAPQVTPCPESKVGTTPRSGRKTPSKSPSILRTMSSKIFGDSDTEDGQVSKSGPRSILKSMGSKIFGESDGEDDGGKRSRPASRGASQSPSLLRSLSSKVFGNAEDVEAGGKKSPAPPSKSPSLLRQMSSKIFGAPPPPVTPPPVKKPVRLPANNDEAAVTIQNTMRIICAKKKAEKRRIAIKKTQKIAGLVVLWAIVSIQRIVRGKLGRARFKRLSENLEVSIAPPLLNITMLNLM